MDDYYENHNENTVNLRLKINLAPSDLKFNKINQVRFKSRGESNNE